MSLRNHLSVALVAAEFLLARLGLPVACEVPASAACAGVYVCYHAIHCTRNSHASTTTPAPVIKIAVVQISFVDFIDQI